ncbi:hypothetical protein C8J31_107289 [Rhizobium sp. PP-CC-2G-626]|nr:hypothetical protein C8J31_107289 [Rhizobium sp. PP-CC-2G-626]
MGYKKRERSVIRKTTHILTLFTFLASPQANLVAGELIKLPSPPAPSADAVLDNLSNGQWRTRTQLVWDNGLQKLTRKSYEIWDPYVSRGLDLFWAPENATADRAGQLNGLGRLSWRLPGAASYDEHATKIQYEGEFKDGKADGQGELREDTGAYYRGSWKDGLMDGQGRLHFENGDEYVGAFKAGQREGAGIYFYPTGEVYDGAFRAGLRDGPGKLQIASGSAYEALWNKNEEVLGSRRLVTGIIPVQLKENEISVGVSVDRRPMRDQNAFADVMAYISESTPDSLSIYPDNQRVLDVWRGRTEIQVTAEEEASVKLNRSFLGPPEQYKPVPIIFDVQNHTSRRISIAGVFIDVAESESDRDPAVQVIGPTWGGCGGPGFWTSFQLENFGWSDLQNTKIVGKFLTENGSEVANPFIAQLGTIGEKGKTDVVAALVAAGLNAKKMSEEEFKCGKGTSESACLNMARNAGVFGKLRDLVRLNDVFFYLPMKSTLEYDWADANGQLRHKVSPFTVDLALGTRELMSECGEGSLPEARFRDPFQLKADARNYRIPIPLAEDLQPGVKGRWRIQLDAPMSSNHKLRIVVQLADGRDIASRPIKLLYFKPRLFPDRNFAGSDL